MTLLPEFSSDSSKTWYGCESCNIVIEIKHNPNGLLDNLKKNVCCLTYQEYMRIVTKKEQGGLKKG
ncbi:MAG: hypothetical protein A3H02_00440 [Candidatus Niyogibacteria bacterium RIFCSPLOWO2_12_FULL_41_13]|uniref:Uncharacterized protein n=1 Tax=Candidatus Niyogibacteria bacterium RIFCSPLOWO2_12_FULL_41_13 TaxID=1801726 RepID=A0A1G2F1N6_9BACT|nr:MAG: hypothetical protein A3H02_00440 [Candidatus Niyogibacteria bacterium RIFCSPLOWO2_12_FULL_41_13]